MKYDISMTIKPIMLCNMRCKHCFNGDDLNIINVLPVETACRFLEVASRDYKRIKITFHGGEPTLAGVDFYRKFYTLEQKFAQEKGITFFNFFTTNGYALNEELAGILIENNAMINVSFDGPYNHILRQNSEVVYRNIMMLQKKGARMRIFCTICEKSFRHLQEIYEWFRDRELNFKILPIEPRGYAAINSGLIMKPEKFVKELVKVYKYWAKDKSSNITVYMFNYLADLKPGIHFKPLWFKYDIALNPDGKLYPFGRPNDVHFCLGTPEEIQHISDCFSNSEYARIVSIIEALCSRDEFCKTCPSFHICGSTSLCTAYVYSSSIDSLKYSCSLSDNIFRAVIEANDSMKKDIAAGNSYEYNSYVLSNL